MSTQPTAGAVRASIRISELRDKTKSLAQIIDEETGAKELADELAAERAKVAELAKDRDDCLKRLQSFALYADTRLAGRDENLSLLRDLSHSAFPVINRILVHRMNANSSEPTKDL